jgi:hypothetical protein
MKRKNGVPPKVKEAFVVVASAMAMLLHVTMSSPS